MTHRTSLLPLERIEEKILLNRGLKVMLDHDLAELYGVSTKILNQAVKRNIERFPEDFMFQLNQQEFEGILRSQIVTSNSRGGRRYLPYAFTEHGALMLASVLHSSTAVAMSIHVTRAFVRLRQLLASHADLARKLEELEKKYDGQFKAIFDVIRSLMDPPIRKRKPMEFKLD